MKCRRDFPRAADTLWALQNNVINSQPGATQSTYDTHHPKAVIHFGAEALPLFRSHS